MPPRTIRLRRPATLAVQDGVFVPRADAASARIMDEVDRRWNRLCQQNPAYFDGRLYHVLGVHRNGHGGAVLHVIDCAYRFFAVQDDRLDLGVRPLGVKGITVHDGCILLGRRAHNVAVYQDMWEFAPSGSAEPGTSPEQLLLRELHEETGLHARGEPVAQAVLYDPVLRCWELAFRLEAAHRDLQPRTHEYTDLQWRAANDWPERLSPIAQQIAQLLDTQPRDETHA